MSKDDEQLKRILEKKYAEVKSEESTDVVDTDKTVIYFPHSVGRNHYIVKLEYNLPMDANMLVHKNCQAKVLHVVKLDQTIIALRNIDHQKSLKHYYQIAEKKENR